MQTVKIKTPAKVNLTLEIVNKRPDGFHNIKSIMQMIDLFDYLTITLERGNEACIELSGNSKEIPYDKSNLVYKAAILFFEKTGLGGKLNILIDKNIPVSAGLAGGSTNAAGTVYGLNKLCGNPLSDSEMHELCASLGSDLNVCLKGGCLLATGRGEIIEPLPFRENNISLVKPISLGISAKEAYTKYSQLETKPDWGNTEKMVKALAENQNITPFLYNDLETAVFGDYKELQEIKKLYPDSIMSGSGSTYFCLNRELAPTTGYAVFNNHKFIPYGVAEV